MNNIKRVLKCISGISIFKIFDHIFSGSYEYQKKYHENMAIVMMSSNVLMLQMKRQYRQKQQGFHA